MRFVLPILALLTTLSLGALIPLSAVFPTETIKEPISTARVYSSICAVGSVTITDKGSEINSEGSGIILANGDILTAAHVVDNDDDEKLDEDEHITHIRLQETGEWVSAKVVKFDSEKYLDLALVRPDKKVLGEGIRGVVLAESDAQIGDPVKMMGRRHALATSITTGVANPLQPGGLRMVSAACWFGGSGGGAFNADNELIGVNSQMAVDRMTGRMGFALPQENGVTFIRGQFRYEVPIPDMSYYVPLDKIKDFLKESEIKVPERKEKEVPNLHKKWFYFLVAPMTGLLGLLITLGFYRANRGTRRR